MDADLRLDGNTTTAQGDVFKTTAADVVIDAPSRRSNGAGQRRAIVHDFTDGMTLNWDSDYPGGVTIEGFRLMTDSGVLFAAGTTEILAEIIQLGIECHDGPLRAALLKALP